MMGETGEGLQIVIYGILIAVLLAVLIVWMWK